MNIEQLLKGIVVVIDDELEKDGANIKDIIAQLTEKNYPIVTYMGIEEIDVTKLGGISFMILDWDLKGNVLDEGALVAGVKITGLRERDITENIEFIRKLMNATFCPIFIFSNQDIEHIKNNLIQVGLVKADKPDRIFIRQKQAVKNSGQLFTEIEGRFKESPSLYVLKEWENEHKNAVNTFFTDFQKYSPFWPLIMWDCFKNDGVNPSLELTELLTRNLDNRMHPFQFCDEIMTKVDFKPTKDDIRQVLEGERFLPNSRLHPDDIGTGDLFKISETDYLLNIRPQCDLLRSDETMIYCIKGSLMVKEDQNFSKKLGQFNELIYQAIVPFLDKGKSIDFSFKEIIIKNFAEEKEKRIGRLLPPYITKIQQRFALYFQRQGLPRIPEAAFDFGKKETVE